MFGKNKAIIVGIFFSLVILIGAVVAVLIALKQNTQNPVAPTVPQIKPHAESPVTTAACTVTFTVVSPQNAVCDSLTADQTSGNVPLAVNFVLTGHAMPGGSIVNYKFNFGDGSAPVGQSTGKISHTFVSEGGFVVKGSVVDNLGNMAGDSGNCQVTITPGRVTYKYKKCEPGLGTSKVCKEEDCVPKGTPCSGLSSCQADSDCQPKYQHRVCLGSSCSLVDCSPPTTQCVDSCTSNASCVPTVYVTPPLVTATHKECRNLSCITVTGTGQNTCSSDVSCQPIAAAPPVPKSGNTVATLGIIVLGVGALVVGLLVLF